MTERNSFKFKEWWLKWKENYHLTITNKDSFAEIYSTNVSKRKLYSMLFGFAAAMFVLAFCVISFTPIKKIVPGFESDAMHQQLLQIKLQLAELEEEVDGKIKYSQQLDTILNEVHWAQDDSNSIIIHDTIIKIVEQKPVETTTIKKQPVRKTKDVFDYHFFKPVQGSISQTFNVKNKHYGIDVVTKKNETVKATLPGKVIIAIWSVEEGNVIAVQHQDNLISFYKHNSVLLKRKGDLVKAGEVIAIVGNSGELTTGPHLHFEIWQNGTPINPLDIIAFD